MNENWHDRYIESNVEKGEWSWKKWAAGGISPSLRTFRVSWMCFEFGIMIREYVATAMKGGIWGRAVCVCTPCEHGQTRERSTHIRLKMNAQTLDFSVVVSQPYCPPALHKSTDERRAHTDGRKNGLWMNHKFVLNIFKDFECCNFNSFNILPYVFCFWQTWIESNARYQRTERETRQKRRKVGRVKLPKCSRREEKNVYN